MADTDPAATLHALADWTRYPGEIPDPDAFWLALAEHVESVIALFGPDFTHPCGVAVARTLLAVAAAAGVTP